MPGFGYRKQGSGELRGRELIRWLLKGKRVDVRMVCERQDQQWYIRRLVAKRLRDESGPMQVIRYPRILFLRRIMSGSVFLRFLEELEDSEGEVKFNSFALRHYSLVLTQGSNHIPGYIDWGMQKSPLPTWHFDASWQGSSSNGVQGETDSLIGSGNVPYFPRTLDGEAWFLYGRPLPDHANNLPNVDIIIEDDRAYFTGITVDGDRYVVNSAGSELGFYYT